MFPRFCFITPGKMPSTIGQPYTCFYLFLLTCIFNNCISLTFCLKSTDHSHGQVIALDNGLIEGKVETIFNVNVTSYLGIPYAEPPLGEGRFRKPKPFRSQFNGVYNATYFRSACSQKFGDEATSNLGGVSFSEDCLHLNIWVPGLPPHNSDHNHETKRLKPVLFYLFASAFHQASPARPTHRGEYLSAAGEIIVVTPNYRLGFLGFACCGENYKDENADDMPGNLGLYDVILALKWTRDNIRRFGGDPEAITLSGASAGGILSFLLLQSNQVPDSWISNIFLMSGVPANEVTIDSIDVALVKTRLITNQVSCSSADQSNNYGNGSSLIPLPLTKDEIDCLRTSANLTSILQLQDSEQVISIGTSIKNGIIPVYGDSLIRSSPELSLIGDRTSKRNRHSYKSFVIGNVENEGNWKSDFWPATKTEALTFLLPKVRSMLKSDSIETLIHLNQTIDFYFDSVNEIDTYGVNKAMNNFYSDWIFKCPSLYYAQQLAINGNLVHLYLFDYVTKYYLKDDLVDGINQRPFGATHGDDTRLIFGQPFRDVYNYDHHDRLVSKKLMKIYSNFVKDKRLDWPPIISNQFGQIETLRWRINGHLKDKKDIDIVQLSDQCDRLNKLRNHKLYERSRQPS